MTADGERVRDLLVLVGDDDDREERVRPQEGRALREDDLVEALQARARAVLDDRIERIGLDEEAVPGLVLGFEAAAGSCTPEIMSVKSPMSVPGMPGAPGVVSALAGGV